jgi:four helix bundle protein
MRRGEDIAERLLELGVRVINVARALPKDQAGRHIAGQILRCGTSAGSNYEEARGGENRADFVHKMGVSWKETRETWYWLRLISRAKLIQAWQTGWPGPRSG